jgi:tRNA(Ile)-lysidine synthase
MTRQEESLGKRVLDFTRQHSLIAEGPLVVAVSGGQDSVCLLHVLLGLQSELNVRLHIAHLDHQLRGADSEADAQYVSGLARQLGIPATIERRDVKAYQARKHLSLEEAAREVRYNFLAEVARSIGTSQVVVGHTRDDHIETVLMHLVRGTGIRGLQGLQPASRWRYSGGSLTVVRPLLLVTREETGTYCLRHQLMPRSDESNLSLSLLRNRIRLQLLTLLRSYNPRANEALLRMARIASDEVTFLNSEAARMWDQIVVRQDETVILDKAAFLDLPPALQRHLLRMVIEELLGDLRDIETRHIEEVLAALRKPAGKSLDLPSGLTFVTEYGQYRLGPQRVVSPFPVLENDFALRIPGETSASGWQVEATVMDRLAEEATMAEAGRDDSLVARFDFDRVGENVLIRSRRPGDRFQPLGMEQPKKLGQFMIDARIPRAWRERVPVVCSATQILWVVGWRIDERVKVTEQTKRMLRLQFERVASSRG